MGIELLSRWKTRLEHIVGEQLCSWANPYRFLILWATIITALIGFQSFRFSAHQVLNAGNTQDIKMILQRLDQVEEQLSKLLEGQGSIENSLSLYRSQIEFSDRGLLRAKTRTIASSVTVGGESSHGVEASDSRARPSAETCSDVTHYAETEDATTTCSRGVHAVDHRSSYAGDSR